MPIINDTDDETIILRPDQSSFRFIGFDGSSVTFPQSSDAPGTPPEDAPEADAGQDAAPEAEVGAPTGDDALPFGPDTSDEDPTGKPSLPFGTPDLGNPA